jgi:hypothetical protein
MNHLEVFRNGNIIHQWKEESFPCNIVFTPTIILSRNLEQVFIIEWSWI